MTRRYTSEIINEIGPEKDIPAPDVGTSPREMAWIFDTYSMNKGHSVLGVVTGKPLTVGGSLGRLEATARGGLFCTLDAMERLGMKPEEQTVVVQGFGNVGSFYALFMQQEGAKVIAISDSGGGVYNPNGIDIPSAIAHKQERGTLKGLGGVEPISNEELLAPRRATSSPRAALEQVITEDNADRIKAKIVCEGANGPTTPGGRRDPRGARASSSCRTCSRTRAASSSPTSSGCRASRSTSGRRTRSTPSSRRSSTRRSRRPGTLHETRDVSMRLAALRPRRAARRRGDHDAGALSLGPPSSSTTPTDCHLCERARSTLAELRRAARLRPRARSTSAAIPSSRRATASGCRSSRSTASGPSSTTSTPPRSSADSTHKVGR